MVGCLFALCSDIFLCLTCIDFLTIISSLGSLISLGGTGVLTGHILDGIFDFFFDLFISPTIGLGLKLLGDILKMSIKAGLGTTPWLGVIMAVVGGTIGGAVSATTAIIHELPGFIYAYCFGNCYGILEIIVGICNLLCFIPIGCLAISSCPFFLSPLFYPFGCIATLLSILISSLATCITAISGVFCGCFRTMCCAVGGDIVSDLVGDYITDICLTPLFKLIGGYIAVAISFYATGWAGWFLGIGANMFISLVMGIVTVPFNLCGEIIDLIAEASSVGLSTVELLFGYFICCICPTITLLPCYISTFIMNKIICCIPCCWI